MRKFLYLFLGCTLFIISACASSENASTGSSDTGNTTYTISINGPDTVYTSSPNNYTITTSPEGVSVTGVVWSIDNATLATIDKSTGVLTANNITGQITITARAGDKTATKPVNITTQLEISGSNITAIGGKITLKVLNNTSNNLTWSSDNQAVATVENGVITGVSAGTANITVSEGSNISNTFAVTIKDVPNGYELIDGAYHVYNIDGFNAWRNAVRTTNTINLYLYSDLDFANSTPSTIDFYRGTFEGNGHIIKNYSVSGNKGFINSLIGGTISNVTFDNVNVTFTFSGPMFSTSDVGIVISSISNESIIENVHVTNSTLTANSNNGSSFIGIIAGRSTGATIKNCSITNSTLTVNGGMANTGGMLGIANTNTKILGCFVENLKITTEGGKFAESGISGIVGNQSGDSSNTIIGCGIANTTITNAGQGNTGGIAGNAGDNIHASYFYGTVSNTGAGTGLDFGAYSGTAGKASTNYVKNQGGTVDTITNQDSTTLVDDTTVTWEQAVESMNQYLIDKKYTDFKYKYDSNKGYPVIEYSK